MGHTTAPKRITIVLFFLVATLAIAAWQGIFTAMRITAIDTLSSVLWAGFFTSLIFTWYALRQRAAGLPHLAGRTFLIAALLSAPLAAGMPLLYGVEFYGVLAIPLITLGQFAGAFVPQAAAS